MNHPLQYLWRHPRRTGFAAFNLVALTLLALWSAIAPRATDLGNVPNLALSYTAMSFVILAVVAGWVAWGFMLVRRHWPAR